MKAPTSLTEITVEFISKYKNELNLTIHEIPSFNGMTVVDTSPEFISYFKNEILNIENEEIKYYLIGTGTIPHLFFANSKYLIYVNVNHTFLKTLSFMVYDNNIKPIFRYNSELDKETKIHTIFAAKPNYNYYYTTCNYKKENPPRIIVEPKGFVINIEEDNTNKISLLAEGEKKNINEIEYTKDTIIASFTNSFYNKIILDYNFKILEIDFHHSMKKKLNILSSLENISSYKDMLNKLSDNFDWYKLLNDSNYKMKIKEKDFKKHLNIIKSITLNKYYLLKQANKMFVFNENYSFNLDIVNIFKPQFIKNNILSFEFSKKFLGFNPFVNIDYSDFDNYGSYALLLPQANEIACKLLATILLLKESQHNPIPVELIEHVKKTSKENDVLINTYTQEFNK